MNNPPMTDNSEFISSLTPEQRTEYLFLVAEVKRAESQFTQAVDVFLGFVDKVKSNGR